MSGVNYTIWTNGDILYAGSSNDNFALMGNRILGSTTDVASTINGSLVVSLGSGTVKDHIWVLPQFELKQTLSATNQAYFTITAGSVTGSENLIDTASYRGTDPISHSITLTNSFTAFGFYEPTAAEKSSTLKVVFKMTTFGDGLGSIIFKKMYVFGG